MSQVEVDQSAEIAVAPTETWPWARFCRFLHETPASDAQKITLLAVVVRSAGQPDHLVDVKEMMVLLERSQRTIVETFAELADGPSPWLRRGAVMGSKGRPLIAWFTTRRVDG